MKNLKQKSTKLLLTGIALLFACSVTAEAATVKVCPTSTNKTIAEGIAAAVAGDIVSICPGTYYEQALKINKQLTLNSLNSEGGVIIDAGEIPDPADTTQPIALINGTDSAVIVEANDVVIKNLAIRNVTGGSAISVSSGFTGATIKNISILNTDSDCIHGNGGNNDLVVANNILYQCGADAIDITGDTVTISKNKAEYLDEGGILIYGNGATVTQNTVSIAADDDLIHVEGDLASIIDNNIKNNNDDGIAVIGQNPVVKRNYASGIYGYGITVECKTKCDTAEVHNNNLFNTGQGEYAGIYITADADGTVVSKNTVDLTNEYSLDIDGTGVVTANNNIFSNAGAEEDCIYVRGSAADVISNNQITGCRLSGIYVDSAGGVEVKNNIIKKAGTSGIEVAANAANIHDNNVQKSNGFGLIIQKLLTGILITDNHFKKNRDQLCNASPAGSTITGSTGNGAVWTVGTTFGVVGTDNCNFL